MFALIHAAFLTDSTRVVTYELPMSSRDVSPHDKHSLNHGTGVPDRLQDHLKLDRHMSTQVASLLTLLDGSACSDGKTLLHHTAGVYGSGCWGPIHGQYSLPVLSFGHAGGRMRQGTTIAHAKPTPMANLWLTMLRAAGVELERFADSTGRIDQLIA